MMNDEVLYNKGKTKSILLLGKKHKKEKRFIQKGLYMLNKDYKDPEEDFHITYSTNVFIVNGGFTTGADSITILELFSPLEIEVKEIIMVPGKQYSFVVVSNSSEAQKAVNTLSSVICVPGSNNPLYMCSINKVPPVDYRLIYEYPPGLIVVENFISKEQEKILEDTIKWDSKPKSRSEGSILKQRDVRHFGYEFNYSSNSVDKVSPLNYPFPPELHDICECIVKNRFMKEMPDQITVNRYLPGQGIPPHIDTHSAFTDEILSLSILGDISMEFRCDHHDGRNNKNDVKMKGNHFSVHLPARSLCIMTGQSRYMYTHGISSRKTDIVPAMNGKNKLVLKHRTERVSFTFRKVRRGSCNCMYPMKCDSQIYKQNTGKTSVGEESSSDSQCYIENSAVFERDYVLKVYEEIADHFDQTRHKPWPKVLQFVERLPSGSILLDVGCGNGKYMSYNQPRYSLGMDSCQNLLQICRDKFLEVSRANCLSLPFRSNAFDALICIAVIHHLSSQERRKQALEEMIRVLHVDGLGLVYVWALEQRRGKTLSAYLKQNKLNKLKTDIPDSCQRNAEVSVAYDNFHNDSVVNNKFSQLRIHENRTDFVEQDLFVPWNRKVKKHPIGNSAEKEVQIYNRYYHVFREGELEDLLSSFPSVKILSSYYDEGNWCVSFQKSS